MKFLDKNTLCYRTFTSNLVPQTTTLLITASLMLIRGAISVDYILCLYIT